MSGEKFAVWRQASVDPKVVVPTADLRGSLKDAVASSQSTLARAPVPLPPKRPALVVASLQQDDVGQPVDDSSAPDLEESSAAEAAPAARPIPASRRVSAGQAPADIEVLILRHAERFALPASLVRRVAWRESKFDPKQRNGPYWGLMQIRVQTARGLGFRGEPTDLLDADTNMTYAVAYLANAYKVAGRNETRAVALYAKGYYYEAKRKGMLGTLIKTASVDQ
jgi:soluble lytic murein transglycosylase-like protein